MMHRQVATAPFNFVCASSDSFGDEINDLADVQDDAKGRSSDHEVGEDLLLGGVADVAVHLVGTRRHLAFDQPGQVEAVVHSVEDVQEGHLDACLDEEADQISPPQAAMFLACVVVQLGTVPVLGLVLALAVVAVRHVHDHHEGWAGDEYELQGPQPDVGDGEEVVIADVGTARLLGIAVKVFLLIAPHSLRGHHVHHDPKHKHHRQPDPPERRGIFVHPTEEGLEGLPVHVFGWKSDGSDSQMCSLEAFSWLLLNLKTK